MQYLLSPAFMRVYTRIIGRSSTRAGSALSSCRCTCITYIAEIAAKNAKSPFPVVLSLLLFSPVFCRAQTQTPRNAAKHLDKGAALLKAGNPGSAIAEFTKAIEAASKTNSRSDKHSHSSPAHQAMADNESGLVRGFQNDTDSQPPGTVSIADPFIALAYYDRGVAYFTRGDLDRSIADFDTAIRTNPLLADAYIRRGAAMHSKGDDLSAIKDYDRAILIDPSNASAYNDRGICKESAGDIPGAMADFDKAIELAPVMVAAYCSRGAARCANGDIEGAISDLDTAIRLEPGNVAAYNNRGRARLEKGQFEEALADYDRAIALDPRWATAYAGRGLVRLKQRREAEARLDFEKALALEPRLKSEIDRCLIQHSSASR